MCDIKTGMVFDILFKFEMVFTWECQEYFISSNLNCFGILTLIWYVGFRLDKLCGTEFLVFNEFVSLYL